MLRWIPLIAVWLVLAGVRANATGVELRWNQASNRVDARILATPLSKVLPRIAKGSGWHVYVEPGTERQVSATFTNLPPREALKRILGSFSFLVVSDRTKTSRLLVYQSTAEAATEEVEVADGEEYSLEPGPIPNELVVRLKANAKATIEEIAKRLGGKIVGRMDDIRAYRLRFESEEAAVAARGLLKDRADVAAVENNIRLSPPLEPGQQLVLRQDSFSLKPKVVGDKEYLVAAIIDTQIQPLAQKYEQFVLQRISTANGSPTTDASPTHGTVMAESFLQGVAMADRNPDGTSVRILSVDVYGKDPSTTTFQVAQGVAAAAANGATVFNLSLGGKDDSPLLEDVLTSIKAQGGLILAASGNDGAKDLTYPAASPAVLGVTAVGRDGQPASYANTGPQARLAGPDRTIVPFGGSSWLATGTSGATAVVSGYASGLAAKNKQKAADVGPQLLQLVPFEPPSGP
jgi:hypothetical protein